MRIVLIYISIIFFQIDCAFAQDFLALSVTGSVKEKTSSGLRVISAGQKLNGHSDIFVGRNSAITIVCPEYYPVRLVKQQTYKLDQIEKDSCGAAKYSLVTSYLKYVWTQMTSNNSFTERDHRKFMKNNAAVTRGCPYFAQIKSIPDTLLLYKTDFNLIDVKGHQKKSLVLELYSDPQGGRKIASLPIYNGNISTAQLRPIVDTTAEIYWTVSGDRGSVCDRKYLKVADDEEYYAINTAIKSLGFLARNQKEKAFMTGFLLEENNFYGEALRYYKIASNYQRNKKQ